MSNWHHHDYRLPIACRRHGSRQMSSTRLDKSAPSPFYFHHGHFFSFLLDLSSRTTIRELQNQEPVFSWGGGGIYYSANQLWQNITQPTISLKYKNLFWAVFYPYIVDVPKNCKILKNLLLGPFEFNQRSAWPLTIASYFPRVRRHTYTQFWQCDL